MSRATSRLPPDCGYTQYDSVVADVTGMSTSKILLYENEDVVLTSLPEYISAVEPVCAVSLRGALSIPVSPQQ